MGAANRHRAVEDNGILVPTLSIPRPAGRAPPPSLPFGLRSGRRRRRLPRAARPPPAPTARARSAARAASARPPPLFGSGGNRPATTRGTRKRLARLDLEGGRPAATAVELPGDADVGQADAGAAAGSLRRGQRRAERRSHDWIARRLAAGRQLRPADRLQALHFPRDRLPWIRLGKTTKRWPASTRCKPICGTPTPGLAPPPAAPLTVN